MRRQFSHTHKIGAFICVAGLLNSFAVEVGEKGSIDQLSINMHVLYAHSI